MTFFSVKEMPDVSTHPLFLVFMFDKSVITQKLNLTRKLEYCSRVLNISK